MFYKRAVKIIIKLFKNYDVAIVANLSLIVNFII